MKIIFQTLLLFITLSVSAQNTLEKEVGDFNEVKVFDLIKLNLVKSSQNKVILTGSDVNGVEVINKQGKLKIRMKISKRFNGKKTVVTLHYKSLNIIDANEGTLIVGKDIMEEKNVELRAQEGAKIKIALNSKNLKIKAISGGVITTRGQSKFQEIALNTGGVYKGEKFETEYTNVTIKAAGEAEIKASDIVNVKIRAGGNVKIYGNPQTVNENKILGGTIERIN